MTLFSPSSPRHEARRKEMEISFELLLRCTYVLASRWTPKSCGAKAEADASRATRSKIVLSMVILSTSCLLIVQPKEEQQKERWLMMPRDYRVPVRDVDRPLILEWCAWWCTTCTYNSRTNVLSRISRKLEVRHTESKNTSATTTRPSIFFRGKLDACCLTHHLLP
jgi:hypothetical protein